MFRIAFIALFLATSVAAQPSYHRVTGVAADDTLNVRDAPSAAGEDIGDLPHDATGIEVLDTDDSGDWGRIAWEESQGWIAMRFLEPDAVATIGDSSLPVGLLCGGTEPFWSLRLAEASAIYSDADGASLSLGLEGYRIADGRPSFPIAMQHRADTGRTLSVYRAQLCSDGMSDIDYPYALSVLLETAAGSRLLEGCCRLPLEIGAH